MCAAAVDWMPGSRPSSAPASSFLQCVPWEAEVMAQEVKSLPPTWTAWIEFLVPGLVLGSPSQSGHLESQSQVGALSVCLPLSKQNKNLKESEKGPERWLSG